MQIKMNRREAIALGIGGLAAVPLSGHSEVGETGLVEAHDQVVENLLERQVTDADSRWLGGVPDQWGLYEPRGGGHFLQEAAAAYYHPDSRYFQDASLFTRMEHAVAFLERYQTQDGNTNLLVTNFNSPPDTGFVVHYAATAARLGKRNKDEAFLSMLEGFLRKAGLGMAKGGIHTPNHRWVVCAALAQIHDVFPDQRYEDRIEAWARRGYRH